MRVKLLKNGAMLWLAAATLAGCSTSAPAPAAVDGLRRVAGTSLIGARGQTARDQAAIDDTAAGFCAAGVWTRAECRRHGELVK